ncbi:MAG: efflux RND transporter periplasmic adaptor subunit [Candidatus Hydrogenedentota bacterium]
MAEGNLSTKRKLILRALLMLVILLTGAGMWAGLAALRREPEQARPREPRLQVDVKRVHPQDIEVIIPGFGEVKPKDEVSVTPKVSGDVVAIHPQLEVGEVIPAGELLFRIDPRDYEAAERQARAQVKRLDNKRELLRKQETLDAELLETVRRSREIAREEFERDKTLYHDEDVGSQTQVNLTELQLRETEAKYQQLAQALELYPVRIKETENALEAAQAQLDLAQLRLERTQVTAPFDARVKQVQIEVGEAVAPGAPVLTLANDDVLEISVPLDSRDARRWLRFEERPVHSDAATGRTSWFGDLASVSCRIYWTEDPAAYAWEGRLERVEKFDPNTRTLHVAVRVPRENAVGGVNRLPLVEGMFCRVEIPGRTLHDVYQVPRWAVGFEGVVYVAEDKRLRRRHVEAAYTRDDDTFIAQGLEPGDLVVVTRLVNPLPGTRITYAPPQEAAENGHDEAPEPEPDA